MIGIDIIENQRMINKDDSFIKRILSLKEYEKYVSFNNEQRKLEYLSSRFACKEALFKACKVGNKDLNYTDISILNDLNNAPYIEIRNEKKSEFEVSISHEKNYSVAIVIKR